MHVAPPPPPLLLLLLLAATCAAAATRAARPMAYPTSFTAKVVQSAGSTNDRLTPAPDVTFRRSFEHAHEAAVVSDDQVLLSLDIYQSHQTILGFGGAFTEAAAYVYSQLGASLQQEVIAAYFGASGQQYSVCRVHINSCDFSVSSYNFDNISMDVDLKNFDASHNALYLLPMMKSALSAAVHPLKIFGTPWSPPGWMKGNGHMDGSSTPGLLLNDTSVQQAWANYLSKSISYFEQNDVPMWGLTIQNEPEYAGSYEACIYTAEQERDFLKTYLGPVMRQDHPDLNIMIYDHNKDHVALWAKTIYSDPEAAQYAAGTAFHWYTGYQFENLQTTHKMYPDKFLLATEACNCPGVQLGDWSRGENYGWDIIGDLQSYSVGWVDWNMLLNMQGGPNHVNNFCDAPLVADVDKQVLHYQPPYYYMGQITRFVPPGSVRVSLHSSNDTTVHAVAFKTPSSQIVVIAMTESDTAVTYRLTLSFYTAVINLPAHGIHTLVFDSPFSERD